MTADINDLAVSGDLPDDPKDLCVPLNDAAKDYDEKNPRIRTVQQLLQGSMNRAYSQERPKSLTTCNYKLDTMTGGIRPGHVWVLGADTSWGKSSWLIAVADENMAQGARVLIVSTEDSESIYADRLMARRAKISASRLRDRKLNDQELKEVARVVNESKPDPVFIDACGMPVERLVKQLGNAIEKHKIDLVCIDYLQELKSEQKFQDERVKFREIASMLRIVIKRHRIAGIIASQITVTDGKKTPDKHSIRESRDVSNAAEVVAIGFTAEEEFSKPSKDKSGNEFQKVVINVGDKVIKIDKCKDGEKGKVAMDWNSESACFRRQNPLQDEIDAINNYIGFVPDNERTYEPIFGYDD